MSSGYLRRHGYRTVVGGRLWLALAVSLAGSVTGCSGEADPEQVPSPTMTAPSLPPPAQAASQAVAAWQGMWRAYASAGRTANPDDPELSRYASGGALETLRKGLRSYADKGHVLKGDPVSSPQVTDLSPPEQPTEATVADCLDDSNFLVYDRSGALVNDEPGGRRRADGTVSKGAEGWRVTSFGVQEVDTC